MWYQVWRTYFQIPILLRLFLTVIFFMIAFGSLMHFIEPDTFITIFDGIWWAMITGSTVGYGDLVPATTLGRVITMVLILGGGGLLTFYMVSISRGAIKWEQDYQKGEISYYKDNHLIIVGWNERSKRLIEMIQEKMSDTSIVLVDESLRSDPVNSKYVHFIKGDPSRDETWQKANISQAKKIMITADQSYSEKEADIHTILLTITARGLHKTIPIFVEILTKDQQVNAERAGATEIICTNISTSTLFFHELTGHRHGDAFKYIMSFLAEQEFSIKQAHENWLGSDFLVITDHLKKEEELLLGVIRDNEMLMNPLSTDKVQKKDHLIIARKISHD
ncbi:potassium channel protein [Halalkalibacillus sediminis]|uniref:Potassium channel protein n=1 Tax=Halalkalibacillus sediminis TaxID=2018042 RepID=A0A2I0QUY2_9BACI|nr:potassium channel family protein [Halalkalibacillus sediminis]PKR78128.1 potassium channel protein [Halalkalibacillus sediminis]